MKAKQAPIFITGRFRSGTSFMWQIFDHLKGYCAWYEPLHPQLLSAIEHVQPKQDHVGITDYWATYREHPEFATKYAVEFATHKLYLEAKDEYPKLEAYINHLIKLSGDEIPVLQFNRVDLRLPWLRAKFPEAVIIHIDRNPLQLYCSQRKHIADPKKDEASYWDAYELMPWCHALYEAFPFLLDSQVEHAFYHFYAIYQLSKMSAQSYADVSINLDADVFQSDGFIHKLSNVMALDEEQVKVIKGLTHIPELPEFDAAWVEELVNIMTVVDMQLSASGLIEYFNQRKLSSIKLYHTDFWDSMAATAYPATKLWPVVQYVRDEVVRINNENVAFQEQLNQLNGQAKKPPNIYFDVDQSVDKLSVDELLILLNQLNNHMTTVLGINNRLRKQLSETEGGDLDHSVNVDNQESPKD